MLTIYGISTCDTVKKARKAFEAADRAYVFHDYRQDGITQQMIDRFIGEFGWEAMLNKRSTTWRNLSDDERSGLSETTARALFLNQPTIIKRPIIEDGTTRSIGFTPKVQDVWQV
ncbi:MAG: ArsC family reductase [Pseudomonadota bacterium]